jgi:gamma-glutamyltranspeptidase/glutathione hydrolase
MNFPLKFGIKPRWRSLVIAIVSAFLFALQMACVQGKETGSSHPAALPESAQNGMVATQEARATKVGVEILRQGGNAVDAAVAIGFTLAVTLPRAGNLGGGGFMVLHIAKTGETVAIDYRERAPAQSTRDMFLDKKGNAAPHLSRFSHLSVGVPGTVAGLTLALEKYGTMTLKQVIAPAIRLATKGIEVTLPLAKNLKENREILGRWPETMKIFFKSDGQSFEPGDLLQQKELARSLKTISEEGAKAFYRGDIAKKMVAEMRRHAGLMTLEDLENYRAVVRAPVQGTYRGYKIFSMPPPSSGGVHLIEMLNILEGYPLETLGIQSAEKLHLLAESMKLAYADRSQHLGDPDFWRVPVQGLISKSYADQLRKRIAVDRAKPSMEIRPGNPLPYESLETTHFSVMDKEGNAVTNTYTLNFSYGSGIVAKGTGILLNNEMDDFSAKPGVPNAYGLVGGKANAVEPLKRPLSSMTPTLVFKDGKPFLATGSPGGSRIISTTLQLILNVVDHEMSIFASTTAPRIHHQWLPDQLEMESGFKQETRQALTDKGHRIVDAEPIGSTQSILRGANGFYGASDPRRPGALAKGY